MISNMAKANKNIQMASISKANSKRETSLGADCTQRRDSSYNKYNEKKLLHYLAYTFIEFTSINCHIK